MSSTPTIIRKHYSRPFFRLISARVLEEVGILTSPAWFFLNAQFGSLVRKIEFSI